MGKGGYSDVAFARLKSMGTLEVSMPHPVCLFAFRVQPDNPLSAHHPCPRVFLDPHGHNVPVL